MLLVYVYVSSDVFLRDPNIRIPLRILQSSSSA